MDKKEIEQLKTKPVIELQKMVADQKEKLWTLKEALLNGKTKNVKEMRGIKRDRARIMTFIKQNNGTN
ncbi:MAG: 50S ribosomal protein L29 [bacterium]|nr:50S ribosomal protein L29 [bacterium]